MVSFRWAQREARVLHRFLSLVPPGRALDLGAGCGGNSVYLAKNGFWVTAVENQKGAAECLRRKIRKERVADRVEVIAEDLGKRPWGHKKFGLILAMNVLHFFSEDVALGILFSLKRATKPSGYVFVRIFSDKDQLARKSKGFYPGEGMLREDFRDWQEVFFDHYFVRDDHPPFGPHTHWVIDALFQKRKGGPSRKWGRGRAPSS